MDGSQFDRLAKAFSTTDTRRGLMRVLAALPLGTTLAALLDAEPDAAAKHRQGQQHDDDHGSSHRRRRRKGRRRHQRKARHRPKRGGDKDNRKGKDKAACATVGRLRKKGKPCCEGLVPDGAGRCAAPAPPGCGAGGPCLVFITSTSHTGALNGLSGADQICQQRAQGAGLPGSYMAWLSDEVASPATRFPTQSSGPYRLVNGVPIADNWANLTDGTIDNRINVTEAGATGINSTAWTNTGGNGAIDPDSTHCVNWSSDADFELGNFGSSSQTTPHWTSGGKLSCASSRRLYCFQQS